jgi:hypothetical protein
LLQSPSKSLQNQQQNMSLGSVHQAVHLLLLWAYHIHETHELTSKVLWTPRSPELSPPDFFLWGHPKGHVYDSNHHTIQDPKTIISEATGGRNQRTRRRVAQNMVKRVTAFRRNVGISSTFYELYFSSYCIVLHIFCFIIIILWSETSVAF